MVGYGGAAHIQQGGNIDHTFLAVAQKPENPQTASVAELFKNIGRDLKVLLPGHFLKGMFDVLYMTDRQSRFRHMHSTLSDFVKKSADSILKNTCQIRNIDQKQMDVFL